MIAESSKSKPMRSRSGLFSPHRNRCSTSKFKNFMILPSFGRTHVFFVFLSLTNLPISNLHTIMDIVALRSPSTDDAHKHTIRCDELRKRFVDPTSDFRKANNFGHVYLDLNNPLFAYRKSKNGELIR